MSTRLLPPLVSAACWLAGVALLCCGCLFPAAACLTAPIVIDNLNADPD